MASIRRWEWRNDGKPSIHGVLIQAGPYRTFIPKQQLATFADFMVDTLEDYENRTDT